MLGEKQLFAVNDGNQHHAFAELERRLHRIGDAALAVALADHQAVDHDFDGVLFIFIQLNFFGKVVDFLVDPDPDIALLAQVVENGLVFAFAVFDQRGQNHDAAALPAGF